jgi:hypothetical protein
MLTFAPFSLFATRIAISVSLLSIEFVTQVLGILLCATFKNFRLWKVNLYCCFQIEVVFDDVGQFRTLVFR